MTNFDEIYKNVPDFQKNALKTFREQNPQKQVQNWKYISTGQGPEALLWLVGGLKHADGGFLSIPFMTDKYRIIAPDYPDLNSMDALVDGLVAILEAEAVSQTHVLAGSFGGMIAQCFLRRYPEKVKKMILSTTAGPDPSQIARYQQLHDMAANAPAELLSAYAPTQMYGMIAPPEQEAEFFRAYLKELYTLRSGKEDILSTYKALIDFMGKKLPVWEGSNILIIKSEDDTTFGEEAQAKLLPLYPNAELHSFSGAGHSPGLTQRAAYFAKVREFLASQESG